MNKITRLIFYAAITAAIAYLRLAFPGRSLIENDAVLYTEIIKRFHGINPFPQFTFKWSPIFLTGYYGWVLPDLRAIVYFFLPFLKVQFYLTALMGIGVIFSTYRFAMRLYGDRKTALLAAFLISVIPIHVSMSYGLSSEIPQTLFLLESFNFLMDFINKKRLRDFYISGTLFAVSILSKPISILLLPGVCFMVFINRRSIDKNAIKFLLQYLTLPAIIWLSWAIPNFYRIFGNNIHSFSSFGFNVGSETMKIGFIEGHLEFLSITGMFLLAGALLHLAWLRGKYDIFILFSIATALLILYALRDVMTYWLPFIAPFYFIALARSFFAARFKIVRTVFFAVLAYFIAICVRTDIINLYFDFNSQSGFYMRPDSRYMIFPMLDSRISLDTVKKIKEIAREGDIVFLSNEFGSYRGFLMDLDTRILPEYKMIRGGVIEYKKDWIGEVNDAIRDALGGSSARVLLVMRDGGYYYRVYDKGVWFETHKAGLLESAEFKKLYERKYPDAEIMDKSRRFYKVCSSDQWVENYIFVKGF